MMKKKISILLSLVFILSAIFSQMVLADFDPRPTNIVRLNYSSRTVVIGKKFELRAYASPYDYEDEFLYWKTSNKKVVAFEDRDRNGDEMDFIAKKTGTATITCYIPGTNIKKTCKIKVRASGKAKIKVEDTHMDIDIGEWEHIGAKLVGGRYENRKLSYRVSNKNVIKVRKGRVYGKWPGYAKITIRSRANKKIKKIVHVYVGRD